MAAIDSTQQPALLGRVVSLSHLHGCSERHTGTVVGVHHTLVGARVISVLILDKGAGVYEHFALDRVRILPAP
ncbi:hypothetical protein D3C81_1085490 [compost metagenome]